MDGFFGEAGMKRRSFFGVSLCLAMTSVAVTASRAQQNVKASDRASEHPWIAVDLLAKARGEGAVTIYSSVNQGEALPFWQIFQDATGVKVNYVRGSDGELFGRIGLEARTHKASWDILETTAVTRLPPALLAQVDPPEAKNLIPQARSADRRWYGMYADYNAPAYNTLHIKAANLPKTYEGFLDHPEWAGHVAIDQTDDEWLSAIYAQYGDEKAEKLVKDLIAELRPVLVDGHLALARDVGAGDYWIALNNFVNLTNNVKMSGEPTDYWGIDPTALSFGEIGIDANAPHPAAAQLAANFILSKEGQTAITKAGRIPVRADVLPNPPDAVTKLGSRKITFSNFSGDEEKKWFALFRKLFRGS
jgi:iron(III) transport system substrate-binding protein